MLEGSGQNHQKQDNKIIMEREAKGSAAEVDYLWQKGEQILPVEVKAGKTGTLKSLRLFLSEKKYRLESDFLFIPYHILTQYYQYHFMPLKPCPVLLIK